MLGGIIGDLAGTKYEYQEFLDLKNNIINIERRKNILNAHTKLLTDDSFISDDSILTIAIAEAILYNRDYKESLKKYGQKYSEILKRDNFFKSPFSPSFVKWINSNDKGTSYGNGAAMRVSPIAYLFDNLEKIQLEAMKSSIPTHNNEQAIKGAKCIASTIYLARKKVPKNIIKNYVIKNYKYELNYRLEDLQKTNTFNGTAEKTVPQSVFAFLESDNFEDSIRKAISIGGDTDTIACMTGSIAEAYYGIPKELEDKALELLPTELKNVVITVYKLMNKEKTNENEHTI